MYVREVLARKGSEVKRIAPEQALKVAAALMRLERVGSLVVAGSEGELGGIVSEKDILRAIVDVGPEALDRMVSDFMEARPITCGPEDTVARVASMMTLYRVRHVPVVEGGRVQGIISIGDVVKQRFEEMELERDTLRDLALSRNLAG
jgi:CBS domain-containing protein